MAGKIDINTVAKAYARWAPVYDFVFGAVFDAGRKASIAAAERIGGRILDVGIGTGISLTDYAPKHRIVGVDYCEPMLRKAHERVAEHKLAHVEALAVMDAPADALRRRDRGLAAGVEHGAEDEIIDRRPARIGLGNRVDVDFARHRPPRQLTLRLYRPNERTRKFECKCRISRGPRDPLGAPWIFTCAPRRMPRVRPA